MRARIAPSQARGRFVRHPYRGEAVGGDVLHRPSRGFFSTMAVDADQGNELAASSIVAAKDPEYDARPLAAAAALLVGVALKEFLP
jgi:hypothetical protein